MKFYLDLNEDELRMLRIVLYNQPFNDLQEVVDKLNRFNDIARGVTTE
jgi:hypothetical protein